MPSTPSPRVFACGCANPRPQLTAYVYWSLLQQEHPGKTQSGDSTSGLLPSRHTTLAGPARATGRATPTGTPGSR